MASPPPLVWVTQGKTQHPARLLEERENEALIRWQSTKKTEWVTIQNIARNLLPRRRKRPQALTRVESMTKIEVKRIQNEIRNESAEEEEEDDEVEILLTISAPTPKRSKSSTNADDSGVNRQQHLSIESSFFQPAMNREEQFRSCRRRLHVDKSSETDQPSPHLASLSCFESDIDHLSVDTQEDIVLADLVSKQETGDTLMSQPDENGLEFRSHIPELPSTLNSHGPPLGGGPDVHEVLKCRTDSKLNFHADISSKRTAPSIQPARVEHQTLDLNLTTQNDQDVLDDTCEVSPPPPSPLSVGKGGGEQSTSNARHEPPTMKSHLPLNENFCNSVNKKPRSPTSDMHAHTVVASTMPHEQTFTHQSSAYVQNLAEICHTIMNDKRWRVGDKLLFAWEYGDDLSAIAPLCRLYQPPPLCRRLQCVCVLCRDSKETNTLHEDGDGGNAEPESTSFNVVEDMDANDSRALNLYCRMYYRKGPWFRVDDIFTRYYSPKRQKKSAADLSASKKTKSEDQNERKIIDDDLFQEAIKRMNDMLHDIDHLCARGLLRTFIDEEECGKMAGSITPEGGGIILSADERRSVLEKLGGSKKKTGGRRKSEVEKKSMSPRNNEIWKQMCQQQSITTGMLLSSGKKKPRTVLPVRHHINHQILSKLASAVVLSASCVEYVPADTLRDRLAHVKKALHQHGTKFLSFAKLNTAFRARESPLLALRRCCRLYLCATSGPGDMRGDGTNGWKSTRDCLSDVSFSLPIARSLPSPGENAWYNTVYPGLSSRFGLTHYGFVDAYIELPWSEGSHNADLDKQVFAKPEAFKLWELSVEIRANIDYLIELNDMILYDERRKARDAQEANNASSNQRGRHSFLLTSADQGEQMSKLHVDFLNLLDPTVRRNIIFKFCGLSGPGDICGIEGVVEATERAIRGIFFALGSDLDDGEIVGQKLLFLTDCHKIIFVIAVVATNVLKWVFEHMTLEEKRRKTARCWLRHLWGEGVLAYVLWDCIPILEKMGLHDFAARALEVLVFGSFQPETWKDAQRDESSTTAKWGVSLDGAPIGDIMISRRARGKAIERLMIDYTHILRKELKDQPIAEVVEATAKKTNSKRQATPKTPRAADMVNRLCTRVLLIATNSGFISFAAIRAIARRTKKPLDQVVEAGGGKEAQELGLRLRSVDLSDDSVEQKGYVDWAPKTDYAVAVALSGPETGIGSRCSYFGFEDEKDDGLAATMALNVEELAMEYYATGRLPIGDKDLAGGSWVGWHDEGGHLRTLFRLLCAFPILGMDGGCGSQLAHGSTSEMVTVHLSKYQGAPFDLHVGSWRSIENDGDGESVSGFYNRRKQKIDEFLNKLESLTPQDLCDSVHEAIEARIACVTTTRNPNVVLTRDIQKLRTLSMLAAGFGGKHLSAAFRCMLFDYRHYSGGLPDLLLVRAMYSDTSTSREFVDIGEWVGEAFSAEAKADREAEKRSTFLSDKDDEFLGCSKVGDSGASRSNNRWSRQPRVVTNEQNEKSSLPQLPSRLILLQNERPIEVQCMFVEVKSQNDRLDGRQEDWLNILDRVGHARVCKFINSKKAKTKGERKGDSSKK